VTNSISYDAHDKRFVIEDKKEETLEDEYIKGDVQAQEHHQLSNICR